MDLHARPAQSRLLDDLFLPALLADEQNKFFFFRHPFLVVEKKKSQSAPKSLLVVELFLFELTYHACQRVCLGECVCECMRCEIQKLCCLWMRSGSHVHRLPNSFHRPE